MSEDYVDPGDEEDQGDVPRGRRAEKLIEKLALSGEQWASQVSMIRIKMITAVLDEVPSEAIEAMRGDLFSAVPEMVPMVGCTQNKYHSYDVWRHTMETLDACPVNVPLRLAALFHDIAKPISKGLNKTTGEVTFYDHDVVGAGVTKKVLDRLGFYDVESSRIVHLVNHHFIMYELSWSDSALRRWVRRVGSSNVKDLCDLARADIIGKGPAKTKCEAEAIDHLERRIAAMNAPRISTAITLAVTGEDIMRHLGIESGPAVGKILNHLLEVVAADPGLNIKEELLSKCSLLP